MTPEDVPLGVYVHWPYCARICPYCDFNVTRDRGRPDEQRALVEAIAADLEAHAAITGPRTLVSIFFGGGTPSLMAPAAMAELVALCRRLWRPSADLEVTLEANPTDAEAERFAAFAAAGVQRLSLGVQALDDESLAFLGRNHDAATARRAARTASAAFPRLSLDLIYALPGQDARAWTRTLHEAVDLGAEHLSAYQLTIEPDTAFGRALQRGRLVAADPEQAARLYQITGETLEQAGFEAYEVSNHARGAQARSRHNLVYWRGHDYVGAGPGAHGRLTTDEGRLATAAARRIPDYLARVGAAGLGWVSRERLATIAVAEERLLSGLRTAEGVAWADLLPLGLVPGEAPVLDLERLGLVRADAEALRATKSGRLVLDRVVAELSVA